jgi:phosphoglycerate dehydrogenase-like enzyme
MPQNAGQIDAQVLAALGRDGVLVNVSRGLLVDELALRRALEQRTLGGAALDVFADEPIDAEQWTGFDNVVLTPHIAGATRAKPAWPCTASCVRTCADFAGQPLLTPSITQKNNGDAQVPHRCLLLVYLLDGLSIRCSAR